MSASESVGWLSTSFAISNEVDDDTAAIDSLLQDLTIASSVSQSSKETIGIQPQAHLASFVLLVASLERTLHDEASLFLDPEVSFTQHRALGSGASFRVERAVWNSKNPKGKYKNRWGKYVALKYSLHHSNATRTTSNAKQLLSEVRALMHEPIRFHPNIVRLLGLSWGAIDRIRSNLPALVLELSELGTFADLQKNLEESLPFSAKKKLCWDVSKGLSILHACSVIHGDLKHENVLIYPNPDTGAVVKYVAKVSDFGGSVMDLELDEFRRLQTPTVPWVAPEFLDHKGMSEAELKLTDVYTLGLLVWRTFLDGENPYRRLHELTGGEPLTEMQVHDLKHSDELLKWAKESMSKLEPDIGTDGVEILHYVFDNTLQSMPTLRNLTNSIAGLQATRASEIDNILLKGQQENDEFNELFANPIPGEHGVSRDSVGILLAKNNLNHGDYDYQNKGPGFRPVISSPPPGEFFFDPQRFKTILSWEAQSAIVSDLESAALSKNQDSSISVQISPVLAAFYLFQCYCHEFGTVFDPLKACYWLKFAASCEDECEENYLARAWCWRVHEAFQVHLDVPAVTLHDWLYFAIIRGHRKCIPESDRLVSRITSGFYDRSESEKAFFFARRTLSTVCGGVGMPFFVERKLRRDYDMYGDFKDKLDRDIRAEMVLRGVESIDDIYVNHRGDGLLHMAAALGQADVLKHLVETYRPNINKANAAREETPLLSACRGGHLACALYLLDLGALPDGDPFNQETPLYWLSSFSEDNIPVIANRLVQAGASLTSHPHPTRQAIRKKYILADFENLFLLPASPLSRAVMMESLPAVRALLALGADPLEGLVPKQNDAKTDLAGCPVAAAAVLCLPEILQVLLDHLDAKLQYPARIFSDIGMLEMALDCKVTMGDPLSLEHRVSRHGAKYKSALMSTLRILHNREKRFIDGQDEGEKIASTRRVAVILSRLTLLGRADIVEALLSMGHSAKGFSVGSDSVFPIIAAVGSNDETIFRLLVDHGADVTAQYGRNLSLLQVLAEKLHSSKSGIGIARILVNKGVPVDPEAPDPNDGMQVEISRPAFSSAVQRQNFELADYCIAHGANVDLAYVWKRDKAPMTVFGELISHPTEKNLTSLEYLIGLQIPPSFIISPSTNWTVFHHAAMFYTLRSPQVTDLQKRMLNQMTRTILLKDQGKLYASDEVIQYRHKPDSLNVPFLAAVMGNYEVFTAFLDCVPNISEDPSRYFEYRGLKATTMLRQIVERFPNLPNHFNSAAVGNDKGVREECMQRYKLILGRLEEIQE
ncbi:hypothetical protein GYMLUDRAFT_241432 [Collybiopsis luxurians FD-317 M1]|uniref:Protein kinase domain-containing protein n=1 Tax=Collybiopsis luxurians FD-317 M1 TaxID=944289 RepID=A0A0D0C7Q8_9AGAR|nr:hypothetical protein GYMLUDRAFT_241432 [Collybiopsis luxurians FD-317 M1]